MPKRQNPARDKAREIWEASGRTIKLCELAERFNVPESTVRVWKHIDGWNKNNVPNVQKNVSNNVQKKKRGGQPGHPPQGGAKPENTNAVVTGAYMKIYGERLTEEERVIIDDMFDQSGERRPSLIQLLTLLRIRERRLLQDINGIRTGADMLTHRTTSQLEPAASEAKGKSEKTKVVRINQEQVSHLEMLLRFEDALTRVQAEIRRTEDSLRQLDELEAKEGSGDGVPSLVEAMREAYKKRMDGGDKDDC